MGTGDGPSGLAPVTLRLPTGQRAEPEGAPGSPPRELADAPRAAAGDRRRARRRRAAAVPAKAPPQLLRVVLVPRPEVERASLAPPRPNGSSARVAVRVALSSGLGRGR